MNRRILQFLNAENITQSQLADTLGVARASVSHIVAGRNKPGFDFIESMARHYPTLNLEWLITGKGKMYKYASEQPQDSLFPSEDSEYNDEAQSDDSRNRSNNPTSSTSTSASASASASVSSPQPADPAQFTAHNSSENPRITSSDTLIRVNHTNDNQRIISKVVILYSDGTFQELK